MRDEGMAAPHDDARRSRLSDALTVRVRILIFLAVCFTVAIVPMDDPWPLVIAAGVYLVVVFPAIPKGRP